MIARDGGRGQYELGDALLVKPGARVRLSGMDHGATPGWDKLGAEPELERQLARRADLPDRLWAEAQRTVPVVLPGLAAAGKDGTDNKGLAEDGRTAAR